VQRLPGTEIAGGVRILGLLILKSIYCHPPNPLTGVIMKEKVFISCVLIMLAVQAFAQADCPSPRISLSISDPGALKYNQINALRVLVDNAGDTEANIKKVSASLGYQFLSCDSYKVKPNERTECRITVSPVADKALYVQIDYDYISCGRTRVAQAQLRVFETWELSASESAQVYAIDVHGGCENSYYACSSSGFDKYMAGYKCYNKDGDYYSPAIERVDLKFDLPAIPSIVLYGAKLKISVSSVNKMQDISLYKISSSWQPVSCKAEGDICTQPYCGECKALFDASGSLISSERASSARDLSFDITEAVERAYSSGQKTLSLQLRGTEDIWESSASASCGGQNAWQTQDVEIRGDDYSGPRLVLSYLGKDVNPRETPFSSDICTDCCKNGQTECVVSCDGGDLSLSGDPITGCNYFGQTLVLTRGMNVTQNDCINGKCKSGTTTTTQDTTTTNAVTTTLVNSSTTTSGAVTSSSSATTTTLGTGTCIDGTPVGQCSAWMYVLRCVDSPWGPSLEYDDTCSSSTPTTSMPDPMDSCFGTAVGDCSTMMDCMRCVDDPTMGAYLDYDDTCCSGGSSTIPNPTTPTPTMPPNPTDFCFGTAVGDCSAWMDCFRCVDDPTIGMPYLDYDDTCCGGSSTTLTSTTGVSTTSPVSTTFTSTSFVTTSFVVTTFFPTTSIITTSSPVTTSTLTPTSQVTTTSRTATTAVTTTTLSSCAPAYDPGRWNNNRRALNCNNCYNYGCDKQTDTFAQPGYAHGYRVSMECSSVIQGANADHLMFLGRTDGACTGCTHKVALVVAPGEDFHWYRLDNNGRWSHKPGSTTARDTDESGNKITNPETADRGIYTSFCGYFCVDKTDVSIAGGSSCPY
jgi:hypothetical protein